MDQLAPNILRETLNNRAPLAALPIPSNSGKGLITDHHMAHSDYDEVDKQHSPQKEEMTQWTPYVVFVLVFFLNMIFYTKYLTFWLAMWLFSLTNFCSSYIYDCRCCDEQMPPPPRNTVTILVSTVDQLMVSDWPSNHVLN